MANLYYVQTPAVSLYTGMSGSDTTCRITPYPVDLNGNKLVTADFGDNPTFTIDPKVSGFEEICYFTAIVDNGDNTATLTGLTRNLISKTPYTTPGTGKTHGSSATVVFGANPQTFGALFAYINAIAIAGAPDASTTVKGIVKMSVAPVSSVSPIAVGDNDTRVPTAAQAAALAGTGTPSSGNKYVTNDTLTASVSGALLYDTDQSQTTQNGTSAVGEADATSKHGSLAESFVPTITNIRGFSLYKSADTGTFTGTVTISLQADTTGSPSGSSLASFTISNAEWLNIAVGEFTISFSSEYTSLVVASKYWIVITTSTGDNSNHANFGINTAGGYASGTLKFRNSTDGWTTISTSILYFKDRGGIATKTVQTGSLGRIPSVISRYNFILVSPSSDSASGTTNDSADHQLIAKTIPGDVWKTDSIVRVKLWGIAACTPISGTIGYLNVYTELTIVNQNSLSSQTIYESRWSNTSSSGFAVALTNSGSVGTTTTTIDTSLFGAFEVAYNIGTGSVATLKLKYAGQTLYSFSTGPASGSYSGGTVTYNSMIVERLN